MNGTVGASWFETREDALLTMRVHSPRRRFRRRRHAQIARKTLLRLVGLPRDITLTMQSPGGTFSIRHEFPVKTARNRGLPAIAQAPIAFGARGIMPCH